LVDLVVLLEQGGTWWQYGTHKWYAIRKSLEITATEPIYIDAKTDQSVIQRITLNPRTSETEWF